MNYFSGALFASAKPGNDRKKTKKKEQQQQQQREGVSVQFGSVQSGRSYEAKCTGTSVVRLARCCLCLSLSHPGVLCKIVIHFDGSRLSGVEERPLPHLKINVVTSRLNESIHIGRVHCCNQSK